MCRSRWITLIKPIKSRTCDKNEVEKFGQNRPKKQGSWWGGGNGLPPPEFLTEISFEYFYDYSFMWTIKNLQIAQVSLDQYYEKALNKYTNILNENKCIVSIDLFKTQGEEIIFRVMGNLISKIGNSYYPPRGKDLNNIILN